MEKVSINKNFFKIMLIIALLLTFIALISLNATLPVTGYEISIYAASPLFWILIVLSNMLIIFTMILQAQNKNYKFFWLFFSLLLLNNFIILIQPLIKGYFGYGSSDFWAHYKFTKFIVKEGSIGDNYYPTIHILMGELNIITKVNIEKLMEIIPVYLSIIFMIFVYFLGKEVFKNKQYSVILAAVSSPFLLTYFQISLYPQGISVLLLPLVFYLFFKSEAQLINYKILFILFLFLIPFSHPFVSIILICCLISAEIIKYLLDRNYNIKLNLNSGFISKFNIKINLNFGLISIILFFVWYSSSAAFNAGIQKLNSFIVSESTSVPRTSEVAFTHQMSFFDTVILFLKSYGPEAVYVLIASIGIFLIIFKFRNGDKDLKKMVILSTLFVTSILGYFVIFLTQGTISMGRLLGSNIAVFSVPILVAFTLFLIIKNFNKKKLAFFLIFIVISSSFIGSAFSIYRSPWIQQTNWQFTYADASSLSWEESHFNSSEPQIIHMGVPTEGNVRPKNFNYNNHTSLAELAPNNMLLFGKERQYMIIINPILSNSPIIGSWASLDFNIKSMNKLESDTNLMQIYSNGANEIYVIGESR